MLTASPRTAAAIRPAPNTGKYFRRLFPGGETSFLSNRVRLLLRSPRCREKPSNLSKSAGSRTWELEAGEGNRWVCLCPPFP